MHDKADKRMVQRKLIGWVESKIVLIPQLFSLSKPTKLIDQSAR